MTAPSLGYDAYAHYARNLMTRLTSARSIPVTREVGAAPTDPVGIIGAGPGGLYTALMLDDLGIPYKVIEARGRVGGRLFTYTFPDGTGAPYNYFDVGAMRYPDTESMKRIFHLFNYGPLNQGGISLAARLRPFLFKGGGNNNTLLSYNGVTVKQNAIMTADQFNSKDVIQDTTSSNKDAYIKIGPAKIVDDVIRPFATAILKDLKSGGTSTDGWDYMMKYDMYSTRAYMAIAYRPSKALLDQGMPDGPLPTDVINWCETFDKSTGWYDRAFSETVLEAIAFGWNPDPDAPATNWYCVDGGSVKIADAMYAYLSKKNPSAFVFNSRVTAISSIDTSHAEVTVAGGKKYTFSSVVCTIPLPVLRTIDLSGAGLSGMQSAALRDLNYGPSVKIGMQFRSAWWSNANDKDGNPINIVGGQTYTDRPLRTVVYPSFGTSVQAGTTTTLIASYCWTEDATRLGALIEKEKDLLKDLALKELAYIHNVTYDFLRDQLIDCFAWSWTNDPYTMGAFAFFGPGKFANAYASLNAPAGNGNIVFAGEALSVRHAWVEGALDSAWKGVLTLLLGLYDDPALRDKFIENWGANPEWVAQPPPARSAPDGKEGMFPTMPVPEWSKKNIFDPENSLLYRLVALTAAD